MCFCSPGRDLAGMLDEDKIQLWQLPYSLQGLYYLGERYGQLRGREEAQTRIEALEEECDRLHRYASQGGFTTPLKPQGLTYAQLCRVRGEHALAERVEADWELLLEDRELSRLDLLNERKRVNGNAK